MEKGDKYTFLLYGGDAFIYRSSYKEVIWIEK